MLYKLHHNNRCFSGLNMAETLMWLEVPFEDMKEMQEAGGCIIWLLFGT